MANDTNATIPLPPAGYEGYVPISTGDASVPPPPSGYENYSPVASTSTSAAVAPGAQQPPNLSQQNPMSVVKDLAIGAGKDALKTAAGVGEGINAIPGVGETLAPRVGLNAEESATKPSNMTQQVGGMAEQGLEYGAGEEGLKGLASLAKVGKYAPEIMQMIEDYPTASKTILGLLKGGTVGGAQGAVKGAAGEEGAVEGGKAGAEGGAIGGGAAEVAAATAPRVLRALGVGGQTFETGMNQAGRPAIADRNWKQSLDIAKPLILDNIDPSKVKTIDDFVGQLKGMRNKVWGQVTNQIKQVGGGVFSAKSVGDEVEKAITPEFEYWQPEEAASMKSFAKKFDKNMTIQEAHNTLELFNAQLKGFYKMNPQDAAAASKINGSIASLEHASDSLRSKMFDEIEARGQNSPKEWRQQYGALADVERTFTKRIPVADRQAPMNLGQQIALYGGVSEALTALATGHPLAAIGGVAAPILAAGVKARSAPASLIRQGLRAGANEGTESIAGNIAKAATGSAGVQMENWIRVQASNGKAYRVHPEDYSMMKLRDPGLKEIK